MPLPWKKAGISRLVADHLNSAKQGASLVETGFPTSIVDLFVKNRDGLKRSTKTKKNHNKHDTESLAGDSSICDSFLDPASPPSNGITYRGSFFSKTLAPSATISRNPSFSRSYSHSPPVNEIESFDDPVIVGDDDKIGKSVVAKKVFVGLMKVLFLIVLALGKKQFAIGITVSAFLLLVLEIIGKFVCRLMKQCQSFRHFLEQVVCNPRSENENEMLQMCLIEEEPSIIENQTDEEEEEEDDQEEEEVEANSRFPNYSIVPFLSHCRSLHMEWISGMIVEEESAEETPRYINKNPKNRSRKIKSRIKKLWISKRKQEVDSNEEDESADEKEKSKKNLKKEIKAKLYLSRGFKKIMPNKLKKISKKKPAFLRKKSVSAYDTIYDRIEKEANSSQVMDSLYEHESSSSSSISDDDDNEIVLFNNEDVSDSSSDTSDDEIIEMVESPKKEKVVFCEKETTMWTTNKTSFVCLIPIILVGLEGGRLWAIVFTLLCCLVWKLVRMSSKFFEILVGYL